MRTADVMTRDLPTVCPDDSVADAARQMAESGVKALPVCQDDRLEGIITDWDVTRAAAASPDLAQQPLGHFMSTNPVTAAPDARLTDAAELMAESRIHHLVIRDGDRFAGMIHLDVEWSHLGGLDAPMATFRAPI